MSAAVIFDLEQVIEAARNSLLEGDSEISVLASIERITGLRCDSSKALLSEAKRRNSGSPVVPTAQVPTWETPKHEEMDLLTLNADELDVFEDAILLDKIEEAKQRKAAPVIPTQDASESNPLKTSALSALDLGLHVFALKESSKAPDPQESPNGFRSSTKDRDKAADIWTRKKANIGIDCGSSDVCVFDFDSAEDIPSWVADFKTLKIKTAKGLHVYTRGARPTKNMYGPDGKHIGELKSQLGYVVFAESIHPSGAIYTIVDNSPIAPTPDDRVAELTKHGEGRPETPRSEQGLIPRGSIHPWLVSQAGKLHQMKVPADVLETTLIALAEAECEGPIDFAKVKAVAKSIQIYPVNPSKDLIPNQQPAQASDDEPEIEDCQIAKRPVFPEWVFAGTSLYEGLVKPATEHSSKYPELIFVPAVQLYLNALALHVRLKNTPKVVLNMFVGVIAPYGQYFKSTCCELGHEYFGMMDLAQRYSRDLKQADGKTIITSVGSTEGLGKMMSGLNGKKAILYFDELGKFAGKAGIENSSFGEDLLSFYESGVFGNTVKDAKSCFNFNAKDYCFGWQFCTTDRAFPRHWAKLDNISSGLNDRMFFLLAPEKPREAGMYVEPNLAEGAAKTLQLIQKVINQGVFEYENPLYADSKFRGLDARGLAAAERLSVYFAADLGESKITNECVRRARALADYRRDVLAFLDPIEAETLQGKIQMQITRELRRNGGKMPYRELRHSLNGERMGSGLWASCFNGIVEDGTIAVRGYRAGRGVGLPKMVYLLKDQD